MPSDSDYMYPPCQVFSVLVSHTGAALTEETSCPGDIIVLTTKRLPKPEMVFPSLVVTKSVMGVRVTTISIIVEEEAWVNLDSSFSS